MRCMMPKPAGIPRARVALIALISAILAAAVTVLSQTPVIIK